MSTPASPRTPKDITHYYQKFLSEHELSDNPDLQKQFNECYTATQQQVGSMSGLQKELFSSPVTFTVLLGARLNERLAVPAQVSAVSKGS